MAERFYVSPRVVVSSTEPGSGKNLVLEVGQYLARKPEMLINGRAAAIFRVIAAEPITLLYDEVDAVFHPAAPVHPQAVAGGGALPGWERNRRADAPAAETSANRPTARVALRRPVREREARPDCGATRRHRRNEPCSKNLPYLRKGRWIPTCLQCALLRRVPDLHRCRRTHRSPGS